MRESCPICERRRGKRFCPGLAASRWSERGKGETICAQCCGEQREVTIDCPGHCTYLQAAHRYEAGRPKTLAEPALPQVSISQEFLEEKSHLVAGLSVALVEAARPEASGAAARDPDAVEALEALAQNYQTLDSGLYYEQAPAGLRAQALFAALKAFLERFGQAQQQRQGTSLRPGDVLRALVFLRRLAQLETNGRPLSRRFLEFLRRQVPAGPKPGEEPRLIVPGG
jgi:hypothetical protein